MGRRYHATDFNALTKKMPRHIMNSLLMSLHMRNIHVTYKSTHTVFCCYQHHVGLYPTLKCTAQTPFPCPCFLPSLHVGVVIGNKFSFLNNYRETCIITEAFLDTLFNAVLLQKCLALSYKMHPLPYD